MTREARADNSDWPGWLGEAWQGDVMAPGSVWPSKYPDSDGHDEVMLCTSGGVHHIVSFGSYIIKDDDGLRTLPPAHFAKLYQPVMPADEEETADDAMRIEMQAWVDAIAVLCNDIHPNAEKWARFILTGGKFHELDKDIVRAIVEAAYVFGYILQCVGHQRFGGLWVEYWCNLDEELMIAEEAEVLRDMRKRERQEFEARKEKAAHFRDFFASDPSLITTRYLGAEHSDEGWVTIYTDQNGKTHSLSFDPDADGNVFELWAHEAAAGRIPDPTVR